MGEAFTFVTLYRYSYILAQILNIYRLLILLSPVRRRSELGESIHAVGFNESFNYVEFYYYLDIPL